MNWNELKKRSLTKSKTQFTDDIAKAEALFLTSDSDYGVCRNGGRRGTSLAPRSILNTLKNFSYTKHFPHCKEVQTSNAQEEVLDFDHSQEMQTNRIKEALDLFQGHKVCHIGGGHDHVFPLIQALSKLTKNITIINVDAHLDTRTDDFNHSGTPFRQASKVWDHGNFKLIQVGIHEFSNTVSTYDKLPHGEMKIFPETDWGLLEGHIENLIDPQNEIILLSLDSDALSSSFMEAVSAVNPNGLSLEFMSDVISSYLKWTKGRHQYFGIYEYNPIYDNLSQKGAKALASLIHQFISS
ncbi:MAG: arginase family protein [Bacteriovoracaceae bacterium]|nr:arginase family protein [Bacteriovoracaceae bacterium]